MDKVLIAIATYLGIGKIRKASGTWATLAALPICYVLLKLGPLIYMGTTLVLIIIGIIAADFYEKKMNSHDSSEIVIDEVVGILITMTWLPITWQSFLYSFILFRVLDILKPFPIGLLDRRVQGGLGVMIDDIAAGIIANLALQLVYNQTGWLGSQIVQTSGV